MNRKWIIGGAVGLAAMLAGLAFAQVPGLFLTTLTGNEQINVLQPSTGTLVTNPQILSVTTSTLKSYITGGSNGVNNQTGTSYTIAASDCGKMVTFNNAASIAVTLPAAPTAGFANCQFSTQNIGAGVVTVTPTTSTINGAATLVLNQNRGAQIFSDTTNYQIESGATGLQITPTAVAEGGTGSATAAAARTALAVPGLAATNTFTGTLNQLGSASGTPAHVSSAQTTAPALTSCGTGSPAITGTDTAGIVTMGTTATGCVITFNVAYTGTPYCVVSWIATPLASQSYVTANTAITLTQTSTSGNKVQYICVGTAGG